TPERAGGIVLEAYGQRLVLGVFGDRRVDDRLGQIGRERIDALTIGPERLVARIAFEQREDGAAARSAPLHNPQQLAEGHQLLEPALERFARDLPAGREHERALLRRTAAQERLEIALILDEPLLAA